MVEFKSKPVEIAQGQQSVFNFLSNFENFGKLLPDEITGWQSTNENCSFVLGGFFRLTMVFTEKSEPNLLIMSSQDKMPFDYFIKTTIDCLSDDSSVVKMSFNADMPQMMVMAASGMIENFIEKITQKLQSAFQ